MQCLNKTKLKLIIFNGYDYYLVVPKRKIFIWSAGRNGSDEILWRWGEGKIFGEIFGRKPELTFCFLNMWIWFHVKLRLECIRSCIRLTVRKNVFTSVKATKEKMETDAL